VEKQRPINAEVPVEDGGDGADGAAPARPPGGSRRLPPIPLRLLAAAIVLVVVFLVAATVGGGGGGGGGVESVAFPAFATKNTSRVGGEGPAARAAGVALAVFPSVEPSQRPAAVSLVGESDWAGAIAAAVLAGPPVRAPILLAAGHELPPPTREALGALDPQGSRATGGAALFAVGDVPVPGGVAARRVRGSSPAAAAATLLALRNRLFGAPPRHVLIASEEEPAFAMPAAAWAARSGDPVLFAGRKALPKATAAALRRHPRIPAYVLGPSSAISSAVVREIASIGPRVHRVSGEDPVENAIALARYRDGDFGWDVNDPGHGFVIARSDSAVDAGVAAPLSAAGTWGPLLLTDDADTLPAALRGYLLDVKPGYTTNPTRAFYNHVWVIGDQTAISVREQAEIDSLAELARIGGREP
jgi:Cell wall binding domain 2 (CWB2)